MTDGKSFVDSQITFCVTVNLRGSDTKKTVINNSIRKFSVNEHTWFDVFDIATEDVLDNLIPKSCFDYDLSWGILYSAASFST